MLSKDDSKNFGTLKEYVDQYGYEGLATVFKLVDDDILLEAKDIAELLNVSTETVRRWIRKGHLRPFCPTGKYTIMGNDLKEFLFRWHKKRFTS